jgi:hypothetical protein
VSGRQRSGLHIKAGLQESEFQSEPIRRLLNHATLIAFGIENGDLHPAIIAGNTGRSNAILRVAV